ncbi:protein kinase [Cystobacter fuscus]|uniref:non-specific serine/threonine protein kinase n=2 Tax=Cystobacter fuscus TaxID=43 RepID=A0A250J4R1_9BACT|nr:protein kinase [Cystobacter fuscus]
MALIGQVLDGRYQIEDVLGQGGMGMVFRATQTSVQRPVAVKTLNPSLAAAPQFFERFRREAEVASRLRHPNVITIYDFGRAQDGTCYYVMELLEGESLRELVKRDGPMSLRRAVDVIEQACRGLAHAHEQAAVHRDIKPHNIMVQQLDGRDFVKVLDFGLVKALEIEEEQQLTTTGQVLGTPQYMPPEQAGGDHVDHRSDLYSMGGVFYYCLTGTSPYGANSVRKALTAALTQPVPTVASKRQGAPVPQALEEFFQIALAPEKEDRYQSAEEFIDAMLEAVASLSAQQLDALPTNSSPEAAGGGSKSRGGQRSGSRSRSSASAVRPKPGSGARSGTPASGSRAGQPSAVRNAAPGSRQPSSVGGGTSRVGATSPGMRPRTNSSRSTPPHQEVPFKWSVKKISIAVASLVLFATAGAVVALRPSNKPAPASAAPVTAKSQPATPSAAAPRPSDNGTLLVRIRSSPAGASVFDGDVQIGTTPLDRQLPRTQVRELTFRMAQYEERKLKLDFTGIVSDSQDVSVTMTPLKAAAVEPARPTRAAKSTKETRDDSVPIFE